jgi:cytosine/adenosine deaminase-related metal-dependent hydrolase
MTCALAVKSARYACAEMLLAGIGCFVDMYFFEDSIAEAVRAMGMRAFLGETVIGEETCDSPDRAYGGLALGEEFIRRWKVDSRITPMIAPHATNTNEPEKIREAIDLALKYNVPVTMHVSEMDYEMRLFREKYDSTPIAFLENLGAFESPFIAAHCVFADERDIEILAKNRVCVAHCIGANTKSAKGVAPVKQMREAGVPVALGTDGPASGNTLDMFTLFDLFAKFHKTANHDRTLFPASQILQLATSGAAKALGLYGETGSLEAGKKADITFIETKSANMFPVFDPYSVLVYSAKAANVNTVMLNGRFLVRDKKPLLFSLDDLRADLDDEMDFFRKKVREL